jgi:predicted aldo/keto reductase-like oxidoreductase
MLTSTKWNRIVTEVQGKKESAAGELLASRLSYPCRQCHSPLHCPRHSNLVLCNLLLNLKKVTADPHMQIENGYVRA